MSFQGFTAEDFHVFHIEGLEPRMNQLKTTIRPKLEYLGQEFSTYLSVLAGEEMYAHVAKHARRTKNPPDDTWVAFAPNKRGYKSSPHFQIGLWSTHLFVWFAIIYEAPMRSSFANALEKQLDQIYDEIPKDFVWSMDHTKPTTIPHQEVSKENLLDMLERLKNVKKAELLCGVRIDKDDNILMNQEQLLSKIEETFKTLLPLYQLART